VAHVPLVLGPNGVVPATRRPAAATPLPGRTLARDGGLPGYRFLECVGRQPTSEIWKATDEQGRPRLVQYVFGFDGSCADDPEGPLARLRRLRHPMLLSAELVPTGGRLAVITAPHRGSLADELRESQRRGQTGLPRPDLVESLLDAALALDELFQVSGVRHLSLTPRHLVRTEEGLRLIEFGQAELVWLSAGQPPGAAVARYAAPELLEGRLGRHCDQYSLALIYLELLTGSPPFRCLSPRQLTSARLRGQPDLSLLSGLDRPVLQRALHPEPERRFPDCLTFARALAEPPERLTGSRTEDRGSRIEDRPTDSIPDPRSSVLDLQVLQAGVRRLVNLACGGAEVRDLGGQRYLLWPGQRIECRCSARLLASTARLKLQGFAQNWDAQPLRRGADTFAYRVTLPGAFFARLLGRAPGLDVAVSLPDCPNLGAVLTPLVLTLTPVHCRGGRAEQALEELGPPLLVSLRDFLQAHPERRRQERWPLDCAVEVCPLEGDAVNVLPGRTKDVSLGGLGLYLSGRPPADRLLLRLDPPGGEPLTVPAVVVRSALCRDGLVEVGVRFTLEEGPLALGQAAGPPG
jgi:hypothetical protein